MALKIVMRKIADLKPAEYNPRQMNEQQDQDLEDSLKEFGFVDPAIINKHSDRMDVIIGGHQRIRKWGEMGHKKVPTVEVSLTEEKERELNIRLNKNTGEWDNGLLADNFDEVELLEWGFTIDDLKWMDPDNDTGSSTEITINSTHTCPKCSYQW